eukprot:COSAG02_NODE_6411_length_3588_cov_3.694874_1_plen_81_part_00
MSTFLLPVCGTAAAWLFIEAAISVHRFVPIYIRYIPILLLVCLDSAVLSHQTPEARCGSSGTVEPCTAVRLYEYTAEQLP